MGKRSASGSRPGLLQKLRAAIAPRSPQTIRLARGMTDPVQPLEKRVMMSSSTIVSIEWDGTKLNTYQNSYVAETKHFDVFEKFVTAKGFTNVTSLGGQGYFSFDSTLPIATMEKIAAKSTPAFKALEPNYVQQEATTTTNDPGLPNQYGLINTGQVEPYDYNGDGVVTPYNEVQDPTPPAVITYPSPPYPNENQVGTPGDDIDVTNAWDTTTGSKSVVVAVLDTGLDITHPDIIPNLWTNPLDTTANNDDGDGFPDDVNGWNFVANDSDVMDDNGHGTDVAGIIGAAGNNGVGVSGVNWNVSLLPVKVLDENGAGETSNIIAGINYCIMLKAQGINIVAINESLGTTAFPTDVLTSDAVAQAGTAGIIDVVAAGNDSLNLDRSFVTPAKFSSQSSNVITVAAVDNQGKLATFSNFGATSVNLAAPGIDIYSTDPTYDVTLNTTFPGAPTSDLPTFGLNYGYLSGTSQAAPFVTGIIALEAAANPEASPAQLKQALLGGVTYDPALAASNGLPSLVATSGVANAFKAVQNILNDFSSTNSVRGGNWNNFYGSQAAYVVGENTTFPSFVTVNQNGGSPVVLSNDSTLGAATQRVTDPTQRVSAYEAAANSESINLDFNDGQAHQVALYLADLDNKKRVESITITDTATGAVLDSRSYSKFQKGIYSIYDLRGNVTITLNRISGPSVVYSGIFIDAPPAVPTTYQSTDASTTGANWRLQYGSQGAIEAGDGGQGPSYLSSFAANAPTTVVHASTKNTNALQKVTDVNSNIAAYWSTTTSMDFNVGISDNLAHIITLYVADYDKKNRQERIEVLGPTGNVLVTQDLNNFTKGQYVSFRIQGSVTFRIINTGSATTPAVLSGVFFDAPAGENAHFVTTDTTSSGDWLDNNYGLTRAFIVGSSFPIIDDPTNSQISVVGGTEKIINRNASDPAALVIPQAATSPLPRIEAYLFTSTSMTLDYDPRDLVVHRVALYFADYENDKRTESVTLYNGTTNVVLSHQVISNFRHGKYLIFDVVGPVLITINSGSYPNAVLSGVFTN